MSFYHCFEICISSVHPSSLLRTVALKIHVQRLTLLLVPRALESKLQTLPHITTTKYTCKFGHNYIYQTCGFVWCLILNLMKIIFAMQNPIRRKRSPGITMKFCFALWPHHRQGLDNPHAPLDFTVRF